MAEEKVKTDTLKKNLFSEFGMNVYAVIDAASVPELGLPKLLWRHKPEHICLYRGELEPDLAATAPYLVKLEYDHGFTNLLLEEGWGNHWGIFAITGGEADLRTMRMHFRRFLLVMTPDGKSVYFRYYDPRVLRVYLPTCDAAELKTLFGPIRSYLVEDEDPSVMLRFSGDDEEVRTEKVLLGQSQ